MKGRKRHLLVDTMGLLLGVVVHRASVGERAGAKMVFEAVSHLPQCQGIQRVWADSGYSGRPLRQWLDAKCGWQLEIVKRSAWPGFIVLPKRWVVERTFAWLGKCRRLSKDYEQSPHSQRAWILLAMTLLMLRRL